MAVLRCEPEARLLNRSEVDNPAHLLIPATTPGEVSYFIEPIVTAIIENLKLGLELEDCASLVGVPYKEVKKWEDTNKGNFANMTKKALAEFKKFNLMKMARGKADWKPAAFLLERKFRREFGKESNAPGPVAVRQTFVINGKEIEF